MPHARKAHIQVRRPSTLAAGLPTLAAGLPTLAAGLSALAAGLPTLAAGLPALAAGLLLAAGCSGGRSGGAPVGSPAVAGDPGQEIGNFDIRLEPARGSGDTATPAYTALLGAVRSGPFVSRDRVRQTGEAGGCRLYQPLPVFCDPACGPEAVCVEDGRCLPEPSLRDAGAVRLMGLRDRSGAEVAAELLAVMLRYQLPGGLQLAYPPFAPGAPVVVSGSGGEIGPFSVEGKGISPLEVLTPVPLPVESGRPLELRWVPPAAGESTSIKLAFDLSSHGGTRGTLECELPDSGSAVIDAALLGRLIALGTAGFPVVTLTRVSSTTTSLAGGRIKLSLLSEVPRPIQIPGQISCEADEECPAGRRCQSNLLCGP